MCFWLEPNLLQLSASMVSHSRGEVERVGRKASFPRANSLDLCTTWALPQNWRHNRREEDQRDRMNLSLSTHKRSANADSTLIPVRSRDPPSGALPINTRYLDNGQDLINLHSSIPGLGQAPKLRMFAILTLLKPKPFLPQEKSALFNSPLQLLFFPRPP